MKQQAYERMLRELMRAWRYPDGELDSTVWDIEEELIDMHLSTGRTVYYALAQDDLYDSTGEWIARNGDTLLVREALQSGYTEGLVEVVNALGDVLCVVEKDQVKVLSAITRRETE